MDDMDIDEECSGSAAVAAERPAATVCSDSTTMTTTAAATTATTTTTEPTITKTPTPPPPPATTTTSSAATSPLPTATIASGVSGESANIEPTPEATSLEAAPAEAASISTSNTTITITQSHSGAAKECINMACSVRPPAGQFRPADRFALTHFNVQPHKRGNAQFVCAACADEAIAQYRRYCQALADEQPLIALPMPAQPDMVEILDSSDEDDEDDDKDGDGKGELKRAQPLLGSQTLALIEAELTSTLADSLCKLHFSKQCAWVEQAMQQRIQLAEADCSQIASDLKDLQRLADQLHSNLYRQVCHDSEELPPMDLNTFESIQIYGPEYPPEGAVEYPEVSTSGLYYAVRYKLMSAWVPCKVVDWLPVLNSTKRIYKVRYARNKGLTQKSVSGMQLAYGTAPTVRLPIGIRVIALFLQDVTSQRSHYYPGIVAEPLQAYNHYRYLIFFDDGYAQYVSPDNVRLVCECSAQVWDDVQGESAAFIKGYLAQYATERPMVQVNKGQRISTEWQGVWSQARVQAIDASLVQMVFEDGKRSEWIYRGSTRLGPLYNKQALAAASSKSHSVGGGLARRNEPYVDYNAYATAASSEAAAAASSSGRQGKGAATATTTVPQLGRPAQPFAVSKIQVAANASAQQQAAQQQAAQQQRQAATQQPSEIRRVAKKSTASSVATHKQQQQQQQPQRQHGSSAAMQPPAKRPAVQHMNNSTIYVDEDNQTTGKVVYYTAKKHITPRKFVEHMCRPTCLYTIQYNLNPYSPLAKPLLSGWERQLLKVKSKKVVCYRAPCGRRMRSMRELHRYLKATKAVLNADNFDFDFSIHCLAEYVLESSILQVQDLSEGLEQMMVPSVNYYDRTRPPPCKYSEKRIATAGVPLNLDPEFLCGCDCEDDCLDKTKCQCWQLTLDGAKFGNPHVSPQNVGYVYKRLPEAVPTGIYECNSRCKCNANCLNRVAQQPLQLKLQVFKTGNRGWGLRCLNDVPKGCFVCVYAGDLLTEQSANEAGDNFGDEYFAELDYIEVVENLKEGYEPDAPELEEDEPEPAHDDSGDEEFVAKQLSNMNARQTRYNTRKRPAKRTTEVEPDDDEDEDADADERQPISFLPDANSKQPEDRSPGRGRSIRKLYGRNESVYIMDAKKTGNIGRYFNHSCAPNLFVQNVFVDTHDLRFPWVAFFALSYIRAGSELTWNYNYDVGSVPGKVLYCECGAPTCRGRLL